MRWNGDTDAPGNCRAFTYDAAGNLTDVYDGQTSSAFNSLTSATNIAAGNLAYGYDLSGNRTSDNSASYSYDGANELTSSPGGPSWSYDGNGNVSGNSAGASLSYNAKNQATAMTYGGQDHLPAGLCRRGSDGAYPGRRPQLLLQPAGGADQQVIRPVLHVPQPVHVLHAGQQGQPHRGAPTRRRTLYFLNDGLGSIVAVINDSGSTVGNRYGYDPYGKSTFSL